MEENHIQGKKGTFFGLPSFPPVTCTGYCTNTKQNWCLIEAAG